MGTGPTKAGMCLHQFSHFLSYHLMRLRPKLSTSWSSTNFTMLRHPTYERLLRHLKPKFLLGLTATPERTDGQSILEWFDGRIAVELRLWEALDRGLLCPFSVLRIA